MVCYYEQKDLQMVYNTQLIRSMSCVSSFTVFATSIGSGCRGWVSIAHCTVIITRVCCSISIITTSTVTIVCCSICSVRTRVCNNSTRSCSICCCSSLHTGSRPSYCTWHSSHCLRIELDSLYINFFVTNHLLWVFQYLICHIRIIK
uniref:Uncharacterized protein n=1 Tax=Cacopsylla melanoneura TaxID=428564 RepID=A0A8D8UJA1_9HEMI